MKRNDKKLNELLLFIVFTVDWGIRVVFTDILLCVQPFQRFTKLRLKKGWRELVIFQFVFWVSSYKSSVMVSRKIFQYKLLSSITVEATLSLLAIKIGVTPSPASLHHVFNWNVHQKFKTCSIRFIPMVRLWKLSSR